MHRRSFTLPKTLRCFAAELGGCSSKATEGKAAPVHCPRASSWKPVVCDSGHAAWIGRTAGQRTKTTLLVGFGVLHTADYSTPYHCRGGALIGFDARRGKRNAIFGIVVRSWLFQRQTGEGTGRFNIRCGVLAHYGRHRGAAEHKHLGGVLFSILGYERFSGGLAGIACSVAFALLGLPS